MSFFSYENTGPEPPLPQYDQLLVIRNILPVPALWQVSWLIHPHAIICLPGFNQWPLDVMTLRIYSDEFAQAFNLFPFYPLQQSLVLPRRHHKTISMNLNELYHIKHFHAIVPKIQSRAIRDQQRPCNI